jgi:hypothetical protein
MYMCLVIYKTKTTRAMKTLTLWIYLRTWVFTFAVLAYSFTGNLFYTWLLLLLSEGAQTATVCYVPRAAEIKLSENGGVKALYIDMAMSAVMTIVAAISTVLLFYTFDCVVFIGDTRAFAFVGLYLLLCGMRASLLLTRVYLLMALVFSLLFMALFVIVMSDSTFYSHSRTVVVVSVYVFSIALAAIVYFPAIESVTMSAKNHPHSPPSHGFVVGAYAFFFVYVIVCMLVYLLATDYRSDRSFSHFVFH